MGGLGAVTGPLGSAGSVGAASDVDATTIADARSARWDSAAAKLIFERTQRISLLNPRFGASTGTGGSHVDTAAFQAAVNFCIANGYVLEIPRPPSQYRLDDTIVMQPVSGTAFNLDIDAQGLTFSDISWVGADNKAIFQAFGLRRSTWRGLQVRFSAAATGVVAFDLNADATRPFFGPCTFDGITVSSGSATTSCVGWRFGHGVAGNNGTGHDGLRFRGCTVEFPSPFNTGSIGWVNEQQNGLGSVWIGCSVSACAIAWTNLSTAGAVQSTGGNAMHFIDCEGGNNGVDFELDTGGGYSWEGGRFEVGSTFLKTGSSSANYVLPLKGVTITGYDPANGKVFDINSSSNLSLKGCHIARTPNRSNGTGDITSGSASVANASGAWGIGDHITGTGIPTGTYLIAVSGTTLTMSANATATTTGLALSTGTFTATMISLNNPSGNAGAAFTVEDCAFTARDPFFTVTQGKWRIKVQNCSQVTQTGFVSFRMRQRGPGSGWATVRRPRIITPMLHLLRFENTVTMVSNRAYLNRLVVSETVELVDFSTHLGTASGADDPVDFGIYVVNAAGTSLTKVVTKGPTTGTGLVNGTVGVRPGVPLTGATLSPEETYYAAILVSLTGAAPVLHGPDAAARMDYADLAGSAIGQREWGFNDVGAGTLPATLNAVNLLHPPPFISVGVS